MYKRRQYTLLKDRIHEPRKFLQVIVGPRQIGKTTLVKQVLSDISIPYQVATADNVPATLSSWISDQWETARVKMRTQSHQEYLLVIDEIQKIKNWSEVVKKEWDADSWNGLNMKVILLGSSKVMLEKGLSESLAGRFEEIRMTHWSYNEMKEAFGMNIDQYIYYGGYPGAASLISDHDRWSSYIGSAIVDATINKDILQNQQITKPALLRQTFELGCAYSSRELSYTKMLGQLQDAGNTTTLASYLKLLSDSGMLCGLQKYANDMARKRGSSPKYQVYNNALRTIYSEYTLEQALETPKQWGLYFESAIGAHLVSHAFTERFEVYYWRNGNDEVDYILQKKNKLVAIEVKSNDESMTSGLQIFRDHFKPHASLIVGRSGISAEEFLSMNPADLFK